MKAKKVEVTSYSEIAFDCPTCGHWNQIAHEFYIDEGNEYKCEKCGQVVKATNTIKEVK